MSGRTETERAAERAQKAEWLALAQQQQAYKNSGSGDFLPDSRTYESGVINQGGEGAYLAPVDFGRDSGRTRDFDTLEQVPQAAADAPVLTPLDDIESTEMTKSYMDNIGKINQLAAHAASTGFNITKPDPMNKDQVELSTIYGKMVANNRVMGNMLKSGYEAVTEGNKSGNVYTKNNLTRSQYVTANDKYNNMVTTLAGNLKQLDRQGDVDAANARIQEGRDYLTGEYERLNDIGDFEGAKLAEKAMKSLDDVARNLKGAELAHKKDELAHKKNLARKGDDAKVSIAGDIRRQFVQGFNQGDWSSLAGYYNTEFDQTNPNDVILKVKSKKNSQGEVIAEGKDIHLSKEGAITDYWDLLDRAGVDVGTKAEFLEGLKILGKVDLEEDEDWRVEYQPENMKDQMKRATSAWVNDDGVKKEADIDQNIETLRLLEGSITNKNGSKLKRTKKDDNFIQNDNGFEMFFEDGTSQKVNFLNDASINDYSKLYERALNENAKSVNAIIKQIKKEDDITNAKARANKSNVVVDRLALTPFKSVEAYNPDFGENIETVQYDSDGRAIGVLRQRDDISEDNPTIATTPDPNKPQVVLPPLDKYRKKPSDSLTVK